MTDFESLAGFSPRAEIEKAFSEDGISTPTAIQRLCFESILEGKNVVVDSGTGTGKTLAYLLPLLQRLAESPESRVVCLAPAAELAIQTLRVVERYKPGDLKVGALVGGGNQRKQKVRIDKSTRLICGTPGRVLELVRERKLKGVTSYVLDEPEPILVGKEGQFLSEVLSRPPRPQVVVAGATFGLNAEALISKLDGGSFTRTKSTDTPLKTNITHKRVKVRDAADRDFQTLRFIEKRGDDQVILYVNQSHLIRHLYRLLQDAGIYVATLSQDRTKQQCQQALRSFTDGDVQVLLTTDRAATGIDLDQVPWVLQYELPRSTQAYVHRAGRTGRAGNSGSSVLLYTQEENFILKRLQNELGVEFAPQRD